MLDGDFVIVEVEKPGRGWWGPPKGTHAPVGKPAKPWPTPQRKGARVSVGKSEGTANFSTVASEGKIESESNLGGGICDSKLIAYEDDGKGVWKEIGENVGHSEVAAYQLANLLGIDNVPETVYADVGDEKGTSQLFIEDAKVGYEIWDEVLEKQALEGTPVHREVKRSVLVGIKESDRADIVALDLVIGNLDRHDGNWVVSKGKLWAIDHGHASWELRDEVRMRQQVTYSTLWQGSVKIPKSRITQWKKITREQFDGVFQGIELTYAKSRIRVDNAWKNLQLIIELNGEIG